MAIYKLRDICHYIEGYVNPPINEKKYFDGNEIAWLKVKDLVHGNIIKKSNFSLSKIGLKLIKKNNQIFQKNSIVWSKSGTVGLVSILGINACANRGILNILNYKNKVLKKYLYYFLIKSKNKFQKKATGAVLMHLYGPKLMEEKIDLPSLKIQKQIIDIIEPIEMMNMMLKKINKYFNILLKKKITGNKMKIKNLFQIKNSKGKVIKKEKMNLGNNSYICCSKRKLFSSEKNNFGEALLITTRGTITSHLIQNDWYATNNIYILRGNYIWISKPQIEKKINFLVHGSAIPMITKKQIENIELKINEKDNIYFKNIYNIIFKINIINRNLKIMKNKLVNLLIKNH